MKYLSECCDAEIMWMEEGTEDLCPHCSKCKEACVFYTNDKMPDTMRIEEASKQTK